MRGGPLRAWPIAISIAAVFSWSCLLPALDDFTPLDANAARADAGVPCNGNTASDPHHCGQCGHDCLGGACQAGKCQPVVIADGLSSPVVVAVDDASVYWVTSGVSDGAAATAPRESTLGRATKNGADRKTLYTTETWRSPSGLVVDDGFAFYASGSGAIVRIDKRSGASTVLVQDPLGPQGLVLDPAAGSVIWVDELPGVASLSRSGGTSIVLARTSGHDLALDATSIFVAGTGIRRLPRTGCPGGTDCSTQVVAGAFRHVVADDAYLVGAEGSAGVSQIAKESGARSSVTTETAEGIALDRDWIYWSTYNASGVIARKRKDSAVIEVLATGQSFPAGLTVDDGAVYWCTRGTGPPELFEKRDGTVMKLAK
jgi:hypothetical protein